MEIFGLGIVAACYFAGNFLGRIFGQAIGIGGNVGGVGIAMLFLVIAAGIMEKKGGLSQRTDQGIKFLGAIYIPVIVAMAAKMNVVGAVEGGLVAIVAGGLATILSIFLVPLVSKIGAEKRINEIKAEG